MCVSYIYLHKSDQFCHHSSVTCSKFFSCLQFLKRERYLHNLFAYRSVSLSIISYLYNFIFPFYKKPWNQITRYEETHYAKIDSHIGVHNFIRKCFFVPSSLIENERTNEQRIESWLLVRRAKNLRNKKKWDKKETNKKKRDRRRMKENTEPEKERERKYRQKRYNGKGLKRGDKCRVTKGHWQGLRTTHFRKWFIFYYLQPRVRCALDRFSLLSWENRERRTGEVSVGKRSNIYNRRQQSKKLGKNERSRVKGGGRRRREIKGEIERRKGGSFLFCVSHNGDGFCRTEGREGGSVSERRDGISVSERMEDCSRAFCHDFKRRLWVAASGGSRGRKASWMESLESWPGWTSWTTFHPVFDKGEVANSAKFRRDNYWPKV